MTALVLATACSLIIALGLLAYAGVHAMREAQARHDRKVR
jgi:hypothetical protein